MACLLQPECNFLHGFFRCKLPVEVVDVKVKITSMQGTHIFRRDRTTQVIKCTPWITRLYSHPTIIKMLKTFLKVEGRMGPAPVPAPASTPAAASQFRPPLPNTNPNIRKDNAAEKRKRAVPKRFRPAAPKPTTMHLLLPEAPPKAKNDVPDTQPVPVHESTPWPGAGEMSGNLFEDRNWLLPPNYLSNENKTESDPKNAASITGPRPLLKEEEPKTNDEEKCGWGPDCPFSKNLEKEDWDGEHQAWLQKAAPKPKVSKPQAKRHDTLSLNMIKTKQQWGAEMERLSSKYNLDCFSDSELDSVSDEGEQYQYEDSYETLI